MLVKVYVVLGWCLIAWLARRQWQEIRRDPAERAWWLGRAGW